MSIPNNNIPTGPANSFRVICDFGDWKVQGTDDNSVWQNVDEGATYADQDEAETAAEEWASNRGGEYLGVIEEE